MSGTKALAVMPDRAPWVLAEFRNSYGWAPSIWDRVLRQQGHTDGWWRNDAAMNRLFVSVNDLPEWQQAPLVLTFDTGVVPFAAFGWAAEQLAEFDRRCPENPDYVNHVPAMAELLASQPETPLFGVYGTSVGENPFDPWDGDNDAPGSGISLSEMYVLERHRSLIPGPPL